MKKIIDRIYEYLEFRGLSASAFEKLIGASNGYLSTQKRKAADIGEGVIQKLLDSCPDLSVEWLIRGSGKMIAGTGKNNEYWALQGSANTIKKVVFDLGDIFKGTSIVMRYMGQAMKEYPQGAILFLEKISPKESYIPGEVYVVETSELRIVRRLAVTRDGFIRAFASNVEKYIDDTLIYPPIELAISSVTSIYLVIGYVVETHFKHER